MIRRRPIARPCSDPGRFVRGGVPTGARGQRTTELDPFTSVGDPASVDRFGWPVGDLGVPDLDWADGDGVNPLQGPVLTAASDPDPGQTTPWVDVGGVARTNTEFDGNDYYSSVGSIDPAVNDDFVILVECRIVRLNGAVFTIFATRDGAVAGFFLYTDNLPRWRFASRDGVPATVTSTGLVSIGRVLVGITYDDDGLQYLYCNGNLEDSDNVAALGTIGHGAGIGIAAQPSGGASAPCDIGRIMYWHGPNLAAIATGPWHTDVSDHVLGTRAAQGTAGAFARATSASWQNRNGVWAMGGLGTPKAGDSGGLRCAPARTNQAFSNINPQAGDAAVALTATAGVTAEVDDSADLLAAGAREWGPNVFEFTNATGAVQYVRMSQQTGDVNARSLQALVRRSAGVGAVSLGLYDESAGTFVAGAAIHDGYDARTLVHGQTPADLDCTMCLEIADNTTVRFTAHDMSAGTRCTTPIPNTALAAAAIRNADEWTSDVTPLDLQGGVSLTATPLGWSAAETGGASLLWTVWGAQATLRVSAAGFWELALDGTTTLTSTVQPADGVANDIRFFWSTGGLITLTVDDDTQTGPYDGTIRWAGEWQLIAQIAEFEVKDFTTYRNGSG